MINQHISTILKYLALVGVELVGCLRQLLFYCLFHLAFIYPLRFPEAKLRLLELYLSGGWRCVAVAGEHGGHFLEVLFDAGSECLFILFEIELGELQADALGHGGGELGAAAEVDGGGGVGVEGGELEVDLVVDEDGSGGGVEDGVAPAFGEDLLLPSGAGASAEGRAEAPAAEAELHDDRHGAGRGGRRGQRQLDVHGD